MNYKPLTDQTLHEIDSRSIMFKDLTEQCRRANRLAEAVMKLEREETNPVPCHVMRRQRRKELFEAARNYRGDHEHCQ